MTREQAIRICRRWNVSALFEAAMLGEPRTLAVPEYDRKLGWIVILGSVERPKKRTRRKAARDQ
jgi:hypothetical protein